MGSRNNLDRDGSKRPVFRLAKISQRLFFRSPPAFPGNSPQTFGDHGRAVLRYGLGRTETTWPRRSRSPGASLPFVPGESRGGPVCASLPESSRRSNAKPRRLGKGALAVSVSRVARRFTRRRDLTMKVLEISHEAAPLCVRSGELARSPPLSRSMQNAHACRPQSVFGAIGSKRLTPGTPRSYFRPPPKVSKDGAPGESLARESGDLSLC
jgi:hypothetical protein